MTDEARAVAEVAKTTGELVKAAGGFGSWLAKVVGSIPEDLLGRLGGDWLNHSRRRHVAVLEDNTVRLVERIAAAHPERLTEPSASLLIPLLQATVDEGRPELQALWAALLANAMLDGGAKIRRDYFKAVREMEPPDALLLDLASRCPDPQGAGRVSWITQEFAKSGLPDRDLHISIEKLKGLNVVAAQGNIMLSYFGHGLRAACTVV